VQPAQFVGVIADALIHRNIVIFPADAHRFAKDYAASRRKSGAISPDYDGWGFDLQLDNAYG